MLIKSEEYYNEAEQKQYVRNYYGSSESNITLVEDRPVEFEEPAPDSTQSDRIEANTDYIVMMLG